MSDSTFDTVESFLRNPAFREWIAGRRPQDSAKWKTWLERNPDKRELYEEAAALCVVLQNDTVDEPRIQESIEKIRDSFHTPVSSATGRKSRIVQWVLATSGLAALLVLGFFLRDVRWSSVENTEAVTFHEPSVSHQNDWKTVTNSTSQDQLILLPDGSSVLLTAGSKLWYEKQWKERDVFLEGDGFFEVIRDQKHPFRVYTKLLTTRVLGTSFQVQALREKTSSFVKVKTGKVTVNLTQDPARSIVLIKNEQVELDTKSDKLTKQSIPLPKQTATSALNETLHFEFTPVAEVLDKLQATYHAKIDFDRDKLKGCTFTGDLTGLPFMEKIRLICTAVEASYERKGDSFFIVGHSCTVP